MKNAGKSSEGVDDDARENSRLANSISASGCMNEKIRD